MRILKTNVVLSLMLALMMTGLMAQDYNPDSRKWGEDPEDFMSTAILLQLEAEAFAQQRNYDQTKAVYAALQQEAMFAMAQLLPSTMKWNNQAHFCFLGVDPHLSMDCVFNIFFNQVGENCKRWKLHDLIFEVKLDNLITVTGRYEVQEKDTQKTGMFLHVWTWENGHATNFQHYEIPPTIAKH